MVKGTLADRLEELNRRPWWKPELKGLANTQLNVPHDISLDIGGKFLIRLSGRSTADCKVRAEKQPPFPIVSKVLVLETRSDSKKKLSYVSRRPQGHSGHPRAAIVSCYVFGLCRNNPLKTFPDRKSQSVTMVDHRLKPMMRSKIAAPQIE
jgi:hypothetical protein